MLYAGHNVELALALMLMLVALVLLVSLAALMEALGAGGGGAPPTSQCLQPTASQPFPLYSMLAAMSLMQIWGARSAEFGVGARLAQQGYSELRSTHLRLVRAALGGRLVGPAWAVVVAVLGRLILTHPPLALAHRLGRR